MANEKALNAYMSRTQDAKESLEVIATYIDNHGGVMPDEVNWSHTGTMAEVSNQLRILVNFINGHEDEE